VGIRLVVIERLVIARPRDAGMVFKEFPPTLSTLCSPVNVADLGIATLCTSPATVLSRTEASTWPSAGLSRPLVGTI
jgi:hypothetical protein